jgi:hypothetical protein
MRRAIGRRVDPDLPPPDRLARGQAFFDDARQRRRRAEQDAADVAVQSASDMPSSLRPAGLSDLRDGPRPRQQAGRQARDDLVAQPLRRFGAGGERLLAHLLPRERLFHVAAAMNAVSAPVSPRAPFAIVRAAANARRMLNTSTAASPATSAVRPSSM